MSDLKLRFDSARLKRFVEGLPVMTSRVVGAVKRASGDLVASAVNDLGHRLKLDGFERLASGTVADPTLMKGEYGLPTKYRPANGSLFVNGISERDVSQGAIGDCYFLAALASVAKSNPAILRDAIAQNADGTVTVTFHANGKKVPITVDADLPALDLPLIDRANIFGGSTTPGELWPALVEKAYAQWKGGYSAIGNGGWMAPALEAITGAPARDYRLAGLKAEQVATLIEAAAAQGRPMTASTDGNPGLRDLVENHAYSVFGVVRHDGEAWVQLRNPWASSEVGRDGQLDGSFMLRATDFVKHFQDFQVG